MALGDGIRRNVATVSAQERNRFRDALLALNSKFFPGNKTEFPAGGVSYWFKQDEIHQATHVHGGPAFLPWHRELCNRFEAMLREVDPDLSLHYWDWNMDPASLFSSSFMGNASGDAGDPLLSAGFYNPNPAGDNYRDDSIHGLNQGPPPSYDTHANPADPPKSLKRNKSAGAPPINQTTNGIFWPTDNAFLNAATWEDFNDLMQGIEMGTSSNGAHALAHSYIGGNLSNPHISFRDPFVFLLHSNVDRLWAMWQTQPGHPERLDANQVYAGDSGSPAINDPMQPWAGESNWQNTGGWPVRPWYTPENQQVSKNCKHPSVVRPPCYDTLPIYPPTVTLETPSVDFYSVPADETAARAVVFSAISCDNVNLSITSGPTVLTGPAGTTFGTFPSPLGTSVVIPHISSSTPPKGRIWISYKGTSPGDAATGTVTIHCAETNQDFVVPISANTIARPSVAAMLVLDQSGSMDWLAGIDATTKRIDVLHQAASQFVQLAQDSSRTGDGVGMVSFDHNAYPGVGVTKNLGTGFDLLPVTTAIQNLHPQGATSIGNGVDLGRNTLNPVMGYDNKAMVVFTDGLENTPLYIADVQASINDRTFAIGLGTAQQVSVGALTALANNTGGSMLLSSKLSPSIDDYFRLSKFFMQVLAGIKNISIATDPSGYIAPGMKLRIPFVLNDADIDSMVILLMDIPAIRFWIETPAGAVLTPAQVGPLGGTYGTGTNMSYYHFTLPLPLGDQPAQAGTWHALLEVDDKIFRRYIYGSDQTFLAAAAQLAHGIRYNLSAQAFSNLRMQANLTQNSLQPGAAMTIRAILTEYGIPVDHRAAVTAEMERPDSSHATLGLPEVEAGIFEVNAIGVMPGVYRFRVLASGVTLRGSAFTREQLLTGVAVPGGDNPPPTSDPGAGQRDKDLCKLLECLLGSGAVGGFLRAHQINPKIIRACIKQWCEARLGTPSAEDIRRREGTVIAPSTAPEAAPALSREDATVLADLLKRIQTAPLAATGEQTPPQTPGKPKC
jgi:hypothetical protein